MQGSTVYRFNCTTKITVQALSKQRNKRSLCVLCGVHVSIHASHMARGCAACA